PRGGKQAIDVGAPLQQGFDGGGILVVRAAAFEQQVGVEGEALGWLAYLSYAEERSSTLTTAGAMKQQKIMYYACWVRWQQQDGFVLWQDPPEPAREAVWADRQQVIPLFKSQPALAGFAQRLGVRSFTYPDVKNPISVRSRLLPV
nr:hypothetical protein [Tanacetum cinerariifolium]